MKSVTTLFAFVVCAFVHPMVHAQDKNVPRKEVSVRGMAIDFAELVSSLQNNNSNPRIVGGWDVRFADNYDFGEQRRIYKAIYTLQIYAEEAWAPLLENLGNTEYSVTIEYGEGAHNLTVGQVCEQIIRNTLYVFHDSCADLLENTKVKMIDLKDFELLGSKSLRSWLASQTKKSVLDMQVELAKNLKQRIGLLDLEKATRARFDMIIDGHLRHLSSRGYPEMGDSFIPNRETSWYFIRDDATK